MAFKKSKNRRRRSAQIEASPPTDPDPRQSASLTSPVRTETSSSTSQSRSSNLAWLLEAFSSLSVDQIESVYDEAGCDPFKAAGILGTHLEEEEEDEGRDRPNLGLTVSVPYSQKKAKKARPRHIAACGMVSSVVMGKSSGSSSVVEVKSSSSEVVESKYNYNADEAEAFLCSMLGENSFGMALVRDVLEEWRGDVEKALESLLALSDPLYHPEIGERNAPIAKNILDYSQLFGGMGCKSPQENNTTSLQLNVQASSYNQPDREKQSYFDRTNRQERHKVEQTILEALFNQQEVQKLGPPPNDWRKVVKDLLISEDFEMQKPKNSRDPSNEGKKDAYIQFRTGAEENKDLMKAYYQRAAVEYSKGNHSHASCLAEKGNYYRHLARQEDERASLEIFGARNQAIRNIVTIDLHGQHVQEAVALLKRHLLLFSCVQSVHFLRVITGVGQKGKINGAVKALSSRENLEFKEENSGTIVLNIQGKKRYSFTDFE